MFVKEFEVSPAVLQYLGHDRFKKALRQRAVVV